MTRCHELAWSAQLAPSLERDAGRFAIRGGYRLDGCHLIEWANGRGGVSWGMLGIYGARFLSMIALLSDLTARHLAKNPLRAAVVTLVFALGAALYLQVVAASARTVGEFE